MNTVRTEASISRRTSGSDAASASTISRTVREPSIIAKVRAAVDVPVAAYHVSGEYSMIKAAAERGWVDGDAIAMEQLTAVKRAGADMILTYFAREIAEALQ